MKKLIAAVLVSLSCAGMSGAEKLTLVKVGGEGKVSFVNACDAPTGTLEKTLRKIGDVMMVNFEVKKGEWSFAEAQKSFDAANANVAVFIVKDKTLPMSLLAMESKWGVVNAEGLDEQDISKEALRVATVLMGGASSRYSASTMRPVFSKDDLKTAGELITFDSIMAIANYLPALGIKPYKILPKSEVERLEKLKAEKSAKK